MTGDRHDAQRFVHVSRPVTHLPPFTHARQDLFFGNSWVKGLTARHLLKERQRAAEARGGLQGNTATGGVVPTSRQPAAPLSSANVRGAGPASLPRQQPSQLPRAACKLPNGAVKTNGEEESFLARNRQMTQAEAATTAGGSPNQHAAALPSSPRLPKPSVSVAGVVPCSEPAIAAATQPASPRQKAGQSGLPRRTSPVVEPLRQVQQPVAAPPRPEAEPFFVWATSPEFPASSLLVIRRELPSTFQMNACKFRMTHNTRLLDLPHMPLARPYRLRHVPDVFEGRPLVQRLFHGGQAGRCRIAGQRQARGGPGVARPGVGQEMEREDKLQSHGRGPLAVHHSDL